MGHGGRVGDESFNTSEAFSQAHDLKTVKKGLDRIEAAEIEGDQGTETRSLPAVELPRWRPRRASMC